MVCETHTHTCRHTHTMAYYPAMRKREMLPFLTRMEPEDIKQRKTNVYDVTYMCDLKQPNL